MQNLVLVVFVAVATASTLLVQMHSSTSARASVESTAVNRGSFARVVYLTVDRSNEQLLSTLVNSLDKNETDPLVRAAAAPYRPPVYPPCPPHRLTPRHAPLLPQAGNVSQILWQTVKHCARYYFQIDKLMRTTAFPSLKAALTDPRIVSIVENCRQCDKNRTAEIAGDVHSPLLQGEGEGMKKQCLSHVRDLVNNPGKVLQDTCVLSHDCKDKEGEQDGDGPVVAKGSSNGGGGGSPRAKPRLPGGGSTQSRRAKTRGNA